MCRSHIYAGSRLACFFPMLFSEHILSRYLNDRIVNNKNTIHCMGNGNVVNFMNIELALPCNKRNFFSPCRQIMCQRI